MSTRNYCASLAIIGLALLTGILGSSALATSYVANNNVKQTVVNKNQKPQSKANTSNNRFIATAVKSTLDKNKGKARYGKLTPAEQAKFHILPNGIDIFQNAIANEGLSPKDASAKMGRADFKVLNKATGQYQIRLSQQNRATFTVGSLYHFA